MRLSGFGLPQGLVEQGGDGIEWSLSNRHNKAIRIARLANRLPYKQT